MDHSDTPSPSTRRRGKSRVVRSADGNTITPVIDSLGRRNYGAASRQPGRPAVQLDEQQIERLAAHGISIADIAACMGVSHDTIQKRYSEAIARGRANGRATLRARMYAIAEQDRDLKAAKDVLIHLDLREFGALDKGEQQPQLHEHLHVLLSQPAEQITAALALAESRESKLLQSSNALAACESGSAPGAARVSEQEPRRPQDVVVDAAVTGESQVSAI